MTLAVTPDHRASGETQTVVSSWERRDKPGEAVRRANEEVVVRADHTGGKWGNDSVTRCLPTRETAVLAAGMALRLPAKQPSCIISREPHCSPGGQRRCYPTSEGRRMTSRAQGTCHQFRRSGVKCVATLLSSRNSQGSPWLRVTLPPNKDQGSNVSTGSPSSQSPWLREREF